MAITILLMAVVGPMVIFANNINNTRYAGDQITATYLAQEGIEFVKYIISTNMNSGAGDWLNGLSVCKSGSTCTVDPVYGNVSPCGGSCPNLLLDSSGLYNYTAGTPTTFRREVNIGETAPEAVLLVSVFWDNVGVTKSVVLRENMFDWR